MATRKKKLSERQLKTRASLETSLGQIPPMCEQLRKITTAEGFVDYYLSMRDLYETYAEAYERLEGFHIAITGRRRYAEFQSFRVVVKRCLVGG